MSDAWTNDPNFNPDGFASGLFSTPSYEDETTGLGKDDEIDWLFDPNDYQSDQRQHGDGTISNGSTVQNIRDSHTQADSTDGRYIDRSPNGSAATQREHDQAREHERLDKARNHQPAGMASDTTGQHAGSDDEGRVDSRTADAVKWASEQLRRNRVAGNEGDDYLSGNTGVASNAKLRILEAPEFDGCSFRGHFQRLTTGGTGEWILQIKSLVQDSDQIIKLNKSRGLVLKITVERVPITQQ